MLFVCDPGCTVYPIDLGHLSLDVIMSLVSFISSSPAVRFYKTIEKAVPVLY